MQAASLLHPYSQLVLEVAAVIAAGALLARLAGQPLRIATALAGGLLVLVLSASALWQTVSADGPSQREDLEVRAGVEPEEKCLTDQSAGRLIPLARLIKDVMPGDAVYAGVTDPCLAFQLLPRLPSRPEQTPDWEVYTGGLPPELQRQAARERALPPGRRTVFATVEGLGVRRLPDPAD